jgi:hypothetical protein
MARSARFRATWADLLAPRHVCYLFLPVRRPLSYLLQLGVEGGDDRLRIGDQAGVSGDPQRNLAVVAQDADAQPQAGGRRPGRAVREGRARS